MTENLIQIQKIIQHPIIYNQFDYVKPGYAATAIVQCDDCKQKNVFYYVSNPQCSNFDLCCECFNRHMSGATVERTSKMDEIYDKVWDMVKK